MAKEQGESAGSVAVRPTRPPSESKSAFDWRWVVPLCIFTPIVIWAYWPTLVDIISAWTSNPDYTHGFLVIPLAVWLLWARRNSAPRLAITLDWRGLALIAVAGLVRCLAGRFYIPQLDAWTIPIWVGGIVWLLFGWSMFKWALPAIAFLWFATPLPGTLEIALSTPLQRIAARLSTFVLRVMGQPAIVEGTTILLDEHVLDVERACSGLRMFYGIFALACACIALARPARWKAVLVLLAAAPIAIFANVLRIVATSILMKYASTETAQKFSHDFAGIVMIPFAVVLFLLFLMILGRIVDRFQEGGGVAWLTKWGLATFLVAAAIVLWGRHQGANAISTLRETSARYENEQNWSKAIQYLTRYSRAKQDDNDAFVHLAELYRTHAVAYSDQNRAIDLLRTAWQRDPKREDLALSGIQLAMRIQNFDDAVQISGELLSQTKQPEMVATVTKIRAEALYAILQKGEDSGAYTWDSVKDALEKSLKLPNYEISHASVLAQVYRQHLNSMPEDERIKLADQLMDRIVKERAEDPLAWLARGQYRSLYGGQTPESKKIAEQDLTQALALVDKQPASRATVPVLLIAATQARQRRDEKLQTTYLQRAIEASPADFRPYLMLAEVQRSGGTKPSRDEAIKTLRKGTENTGQTTGPFTLPLASLLAENGELEQAEAEIAPIERGLPHMVGRDKGVVKLGVALIRNQIINAREGPQKALAYLKGVLEESDVRLAERQIPQSLAQAYVFLARLYTTLGASDLALDNFRRAARLDPANVDLQLQAAALAQQTGDLDAADRDFRALIQSGKGNADTRAAVVEVEIKRQLQRPKADRDWRQAKRMLESASQLGASPVVVRLLAAEILAASGEDDKAEQTIVKLTEEYPKDPASWRSLAVFRQLHGKTQAALEAADDFADVTKNSVEAAALRAAILAESGKVDEAVATLNQAVDKAEPDKLPQAALSFANLLNQVGRHAESFDTLEKAHEKSPHNLQILDTLANMAWLDQDWKRLEKYEKWLHDVEGDGGTIWRSYRAQRLLTTARSVNDKDFQEVISQVDTITRDRPRWAKAHFLQGEIAYRMNRVDAAAAAYERAWKFGGRGILLADRLIDLLTRQGRFDEAKSYVVQIQDYVEHSQGLFDRALPYLAKGNESVEMMQLAQQWVKQNPKDAEARLRLGRLLLMRARSVPEEEKKQYVDQAESEFKSAIELAPDDARTWAASVLLYGESPETRDRALQVLEDFAKQTNISGLQRDFVLAQLYESLGYTARSQIYLQQATASAQADPTSPAAAEVLGKAAQFYMGKSALLSEYYARLALAQNPAIGEARLALLASLANRSDEQGLQEALRILDEKETAETIDPAVEPRLRAAILSQRGQPKDLELAIEAMQRSISQTREDKLLLARLYERTGQIPSALELYEQLARPKTASPGEMAEYLRFWQEHFLKNADAEAGTQFGRQAKEIYQRLGELPDQLHERLRWQIRELKARNPKQEITGPAAASLVAEILATPTAQKLKEAEAKQLFQKILIVLLQEECEDGAIQLTTAPPKPVTPENAATWLCNAYVTVPNSKSDATRQQAIDGLLSKYSDNRNVLQAIGDHLFMAGKYDKAVDAYQRVLAIKADDRVARNNLALALAELPSRSEEARQVLSVALKAEEENADLLDTQAMLDIIDKHADRAVPVLEKIAQQHPESAVLRLHLANAYHEVQDADRARDNLLAATALGVQQRILSPRDRQCLETLQERYIASQMTSVADRKSSSSVIDSKSAPK